MINEENLKKMYEGILKDQELTTKELKGYGFNSKDLADLIEDGTLVRIKRGYYSFKSIDDLYYYGKKLISMEEYDKATACFKKCYELDPNHSGVCFQLFLRCIQNRDYENAFKYFDNIYNTANEYYNTDNNYYLYLLSMITELPEHHRKYAKLFKLRDIIVDFNDKRYNDVSTQNKIRISSLNQRFILASKQLNDLIKQNGKLSAQDIIIRTLLNQAVEEQIRIKRYIAKLVNEKQYEEVIEYLETLKEQHNLSLADEYTLSLTKDLTEIIRTGIIPEKQVFSTNKLFDAVNGKNYELALSLSTEYIKKRNIDANDNAMYLLLTEIKNIIDKKNDIATLPEKQKTEEITPVIVEKQQVMNLKTENISTSCSNTFADVTKYLMKNDLDNAFITLKNYLDNIGKRQYEFLMIDLIKISLIEGDIAFTKPMIALTYVARENFEFNISEYIQNFYETLVQNNFDVARIYLDIISKSNNLGQSCILTEGLEQVLNNTEKMMHYQRNNEILNKVESSIQNIKDTPISITEKSQYVDQTPSIIPEVTSKQQVIEEIPIQQIEQPINEIDMSPSKNKDYDDNEFISQKLDELYEKGMILLRPMDLERRKGIHEIVKDIPDVDSFSVGTQSSRQVVLVLRPYPDEDFDFSSLAKDGNIAYKSGDYDLCIEKYRQILEFGNPKAWVYAKIGLSYMKKLDKDTAISYLTVATELSKEEESDFDFTELIGSLNGLISQEDKKPRFKMTTNDFENDLYENYGIEYVRDIAELVSSGISFDEACESMNINREQKSIISLIFAKECYATENYTMGDKYLKNAEKDKNKTKFVNKLIEEVKRNKRFYKNRLNENYELLLTPTKKII